MEPVAFGLMIVAAAALDVALRGLAGAVPRQLSRMKAAREKRSERGPVVQAVRAAAQQMGLRFDREPRLHGARMEGDLDGTHILVQCGAHTEKPWLTTITVRPQRPLPPDVWLRSRWRADASLVEFRSAPTEPAVDIGDPAFDKLIAVGGRVAAAHALVSAPARHALVALAREGTIKLQEGEFVYETLDRITSPSRLATLVRHTLAVIATLPRASDVTGALIADLRDDPEPGVRSHCLAALLADAPDDPRTPSALDTALADPSDAVRVAAARAVGERGLPVLREIIAREDSEEQIAARAIAVLGRRLTSDQTLAILDAALRAGRGTVALSAIEVLGRIGDESACRRLRALLNDADAALAVAAVDALGLVHSTAVEEELQRALSSPSLAVRDAAIGALGRVGRLASIEPLRALIEATKTVPNSIFAARQAIAAIQARLTGASPGQVSLAESASGDLSLVEGDASGRLSLPREPPPE